MKQNKNLMKNRLDMGYGNPGFLQELWNKDIPYDIDGAVFNNMPYSSSKDILPALEKQIKAIHKKHKNCQINKESEIIVTVGAAQAVQAALYAYKKLDKTNVYIPAPHWGRLVTYAKMQSYSVAYSTIDAEYRLADKKNLISLITSPNNPTGEMQTDLAADIRDACYNWPQYIDKPALLNDKVVVFSLSKLTGHSSTRIGWAIVNDPEIAQYMKEYIEISTSGVSLEAQYNAAYALETIQSGMYLKNDDKFDFFKVARTKLKIRIEIVKDVIREFNLPIKVISKGGMFLYIETRPQLIHDLKITCFAGSASGDTNKDRFRLNIGCDTKTFVTFIDRLEYIGKLYKTKN